MNVPEKPKVNVTFRDNFGKDINLIVDIYTTIEELYVKYSERAPSYVNDIRKIKFVVNGEALEQNDKTKIKDYFRSQINSNSPTFSRITVNVQNL